MGFTFSALCIFGTVSHANRGFYRGRRKPHYCSVSCNKTFYVLTDNLHIH